ncbi:MAG: ATP-binding protein [Candidatus Gastranaerophilaceae bacterium]
MISYILNSNLCIVLIVINIVLLSVIHNLLKKIDYSKNKHNDIAEYVANLISTINSVRYGNLIARLGKHPNKNLNEVSKCINRMIETLNDREKMIIEYQGELRRKNDFLEAIINSLSDGVLVVDENYKILQATKNIYKWFGTKKIVSKELTKFIKPATESSVITLDEDEIFIENEPEKKFLASSSLIDAQETDNKYLVVIKDVTTQKEIETLKEDFVATLTHDLKVPIIAESNMLSFLLTEKFGTLNIKQTEAIKTMQASNKELLNLVRIVLDTYKMEDGGIVLYKEPVILKEFIDEIILEMAPIADDSKNKLISKIPINIELELDVMQMRRVFKNLIQNAISYGKTNSNIDIKAIKRDKNIIISVKDYGRGIPKEDIDKIFNKYYSANKKFRKIGTGLGLYLSKEIVEAHGGKLIVQSEENKYTEFCITLSM